MPSLVGRFASSISNYRIRAWFVFIFACGSFSFFAPSAQAATLFLSPASGSYAVGKTFTVNVMVSSPDQAANAYSGAISYPTDKLEMIGIGKAGSIVSLWVQEPSYSAGRANFEGVTFNPGYKGGAGRMVTLSFKAKAAGIAAVRFSTGSVLANDGEGTNILTGMGSANFTITGAGEAPPEVVPGIPSSPRISSTSHPDPTKWYAVSDATFKWGLQSGVDAVNILADQNPTSDPGTSSDGLFSSHTYENVQEGVWYFHLRVRNQYGWSPASHFKFQIDTKKPDSFTITEALSNEANQTTKAFKFEASDSGSGVDHYDIRIDGEAVAAWVDDGTHIYHTPPVSPGAHTLLARAVDKAGNFLEATAAFTIEGLAPPRITEYPRAPRSGDTLVLKGVTVPNSRVTIWVQKGEAQPYSKDVTSDSQGRFTFVAETPLEQADYRVWATVTDSLGNTSMPSEKIAIAVRPPPFDMLGFLSRLFHNIFFYIFWIWLLLLLLAYLLWKYLTLKKKLGYDVHGAQEALHKTFDLLADDIQDQVKMLEKAKTKRELTLEEDRILKKLKRDLKVAETYIRKRIDAIQKRK